MHCAALRRMRSISDDWAGPCWSHHRFFALSCYPQLSLIPTFSYWSHPLSHLRLALTRMYLRTDFNKRAEILLKLSKEQVMGKEFELIDIIDFDREKVFLRKSLCAFLIQWDVSISPLIMPGTYALHSLLSPCIPPPLLVPYAPVL